MTKVYLKKETVKCGLALEISQFCTELLMQLILWEDSVHWKVNDGGFFFELCEEAQYLYLSRRDNIMIASSVFFSIPQLNKTESNCQMKHSEVAKQAFG